MEEVSREAIALSEAASAPLVLARGQTLLGTALIYQGRVEEAKAEIDRATGAYRSAGGPARRGYQPANGRAH